MKTASRRRKKNAARSCADGDIKIGAAIRARRLEIGMSQELMAARIGVTFQQVQKYEKGVNRVAVTRLYQIAQALDTRASLLMATLGKYACLLVVVL